MVDEGRIVAQGTESELVQQVFPTARVEVRVARASGDVAAALRAVPGVTAVEPLASREGAAGFVVESEHGRDVRGELVRLVTGRGWELQELHQVGMSLEERLGSLVPGAEIQTYPGWGHDFPPGMIPTLIDRMDNAADRAYNGWPERLVGRYGETQSARRPGSAGAPRSTIESR